MYSSAEIETSVRGSYAPLSQTYCGKGIPQIPYQTYDPPVSTERRGSCPADWERSRIPSMSTQLVLNSYQYPHYTALTHNSPYSSSPYFSMGPAYGNGQNGYEMLYRSCDGSFEKVLPS